MVLDVAEHSVPQITKLSQDITNSIQKVDNTSSDYSFFENPVFHVSIMKLNGLTEEEYQSLETYCGSISASESVPDKIIEMEVKSVIFRSGD